jgi:hypothetical protein
MDDGWTAHDPRMLGYQTFGPLLGASQGVYPERLEPIEHDSILCILASEGLQIWKGLLRDHLFCAIIIMAFQRDNAATIGTMRRDKLMGNVHLVEVTLTSWRVLFGLC